MTIGGIPLVAFFTAMLAAGLVAAAPLVMAALGEAVGEKSGLLNLGIEGMMLCGAFFGFYAAYQTGERRLGRPGRDWRRVGARAVLRRPDRLPAGRSGARRAGDHHLRRRV